MSFRRRCSTPRASASRAPASSSSASRPVSGVPGWVRRQADRRHRHRRQHRLQRRIADHRRRRQRRHQQRAPRAISSPSTITSTGRAAAIRSKPAAGCSASSPTTISRRTNTARPPSAPCRPSCRAPQNLHRRSRAHRTRLALARRRGFFEDTIKVTPRLELRAGLPLRIHQRLERIAGPRRQLRDRQRRSANQPRRRQLRAHRQPRQIPARTAPRPRVGRSGQRQNRAFAPASASITPCSIRSTTASTSPRPSTPRDPSKISPVSSLNFTPGVPPPAAAKVSPSNVQPDIATPTVLTWSLRLEQQSLRTLLSPSATSARTATTRSSPKT